MSDRPKQPYADMLRTAELLVAKLAPACERIEIAGSLRRKKPLVSDIEICAIPKPVLNLIGEPSGQTEVDLLLDSLPVNFAKRGRKYQQFWFDGSRLPFWVDLFLQPDPATWGMNLMIRTGSAEFSKRMVTSTMFGGHKPDGYSIVEARVYDGDGAMVDTSEEEMVFHAWNMKYVKPEDRI